MVQLLTLLQKNWITFKRNKFFSLTDIFLPPLILLLLTILRYQDPVQLISKTQFINNPLITTYYPSNFTLNSSNLKNCNYNLVDGKYQRNGIIALAPPNDSIILLLSRTLTNLNYTTQFFDSGEQIQKLASHQDYGIDSDHPTICFGISMQSSSPNYQYKLHFNITPVLWNDLLKNQTSQGPSTLFPSTLDIPIFLNTTIRPEASGMLSINNLILNFIFRQETNDDNIQLIPIITSMAQQQYGADSLYDIISPDLQPFILLPLILVYLRQISWILEQKNKKLKETLKIMGMSNLSYFLSWFLYFFLVYFIITLMEMVILIITFPNIQIDLFFAVSILFSLVLIFQAFFIQTLFDTPKTAIIIGLLFYTFEYLIVVFIQNSEGSTPLQKQYASISPHVAFGYCFRQLLYACTYGVNLKNKLNQNVNDYTFSTGLISLSVNMIVWFILFIYLEQVFPNEWGLKKHPLFFLDYFKCQKKIKKQENKNEITTLQQISNNEENKQYQNCQKLIIKNLSKELNQKKIINDLNITANNNQILAMLGHNGAGKTTVISIITGLLQQTQGIVYALGHDTRKQIDELRKKIGICPQNNALYQEMTVYQNLKIVGGIKDIKFLQTQINKQITQIGLQEIKDYFVKDLSGGQKRKLAVALAFFGGSKLIILDEPTSSMDPSSRRYIWDLIKKYRSQRIIILTTHFMDQADYLGDKIVIMMQGKLLFIGSSYELKKKYSDGYTISVICERKLLQQTKLLNQVKRIIPEATKKNESNNQIQLMLPLHTIQKFSTLFSFLDTKKEQYKIKSYCINESTLQEIFLKIYEMQQIKSSNKLESKQSELLINSSNNLFEPIEGSVSFSRQFCALMIKRFRIWKRDTITMIFEYAVPIIIILLAFGFMSLYLMTNLPPQNINLQIFKQQGYPLRLPISGNITLHQLDNINFQFKSDYGDKLNTTYQKFDSVEEFDMKYLLTQKTSKMKGGIYLLPKYFMQVLDSTAQKTLMINTYPYYCLINTRSPTTPLLFPALITQSLTNLLNNKNITITPINSPLPITYNAKKRLNIINGFYASFFFSVALALTFSSILAFIMKENQLKCKYQQIIAGMNPATYWFSNFVFDFCSYMIIASFCVIMCQAFNIKDFIGNNSRATWLLFILYGLANIPFTYLSSKILKNYQKAQVLYYLCTAIKGTVIPIFIYLLRFLGGNTSKTSKYISYILQLFPSVAFGVGVINLGSLKQLENVQNKDYQAFDMEIAFRSIIYLSIQAFVFTFLLFFVQTIGKKYSFKNLLFNSDQYYSNPTMDTLNNNQKNIQNFENIVQNNQERMSEENIIQSMTTLEHLQDNAIVAKNLKKIYKLQKNKIKIAVQDLTFSVNKGEIFGLLGVNGAGKSTIFKMLVGEIQPTSGEAYFFGHNISDTKQVRKIIGYCPQFNAIFEDLTVYENIELFYDLRGLPLEKKDELIRHKIQQLRLQTFTHILQKHLSGGNQRKLAVACATIGNPKIVFLDEPSTGMDPRTKRFLWKLIKQLGQHNSSVIITTHSMDQAQVLAKKIGIMVNGNFKCIGTIPQIKSRFGKDYEIQIKFRNPSKQKEQQQNLLKQNPQFKNLPVGQLPKIQKLNAEEIIIDLDNKQQQFNMKQIINNTQEFISKLGKYEILQNLHGLFRFSLYSNISASEIFKIFEINKDKLYIQSYNIKKSTLEQIFRKLAHDYV